MSYLLTVILQPSGFSADRQERSSGKRKSCPSAKDAKIIRRFHSRQNGTNRLKYERDIFEKHFFKNFLQFFGKASKIINISRKIRRHLKKYIF